jgi:hypothetical protein
MGHKKGTPCIDQKKIRHQDSMAVPIAPPPRDGPG